MIGQSEKSGVEIESEYQLTGHPVYVRTVSSLPFFSCGTFKSFLAGLGQKSNVRAYCPNIPGHTVYTG